MNWWERGTRTLDLGIMSQPVQLSNGSVAFQKRIEHCVNSFRFCFDAKRLASKIELALIDV